MALTTILRPHLQGAFMAALYAQGLPWDEAHRKVRTYASRMSSVHHLLQVRNMFPACYLSMFDTSACVWHLMHLITAT